MWDGDDVVHEVTDGADLVTWEVESGTFTPQAKLVGEKRYGVVTDHLGTPKALFDEAGQIAWKAQLDLYGVAEIDMMRTDCSWRWPGQSEDEETGLHYNRFRYYDPKAGRYISHDPIRLDGGIALYGYTSDPLVWTDPLGLAARCGDVERRWNKWADFKMDGLKRLGPQEKKAARNMIDMFQQRYLAGAGDAMPNIRNLNNLGERLWEIKHDSGVRVYIDCLGNVLGYGKKHGQARDISYLKNLLKGLI